MERRDRKAGLVPVYLLVVAVQLVCPVPALEWGYGHPSDSGLLGEYDARDMSHGI